MRFTTSTVGDAPGRRASRGLGWALVGLGLLGACEADGEDAGGGGGHPCGPTRAVVTRVIDGDTVEIEGGERVRYLLIDTPETTNGQDECWGEAATEANRSLVEGQRIELRYDAVCTDRFDRLLAFVSVGGREINALLVERGHACVLHIPPAGDDDLVRYLDLEDRARTLGRGLWGACDPVPCE